MFQVIVIIIINIIIKYVTLLDILLKGLVEISIEGLS